MVLMDEITDKSLFREIDKIGFPESVRMILVLNPKLSNRHDLNLPSSFLHVILTTPYRSTIAITSLTRFIAKCQGLVIPEGEIGSDVEGTKPIFFDVGQDETKMEEALKHRHKRMGDISIILYNDSILGSVRRCIQLSGWPIKDQARFYGWEAEKVVVVTCGFDIMEPITRARTHLAVILTENDFAANDLYYSKTKEHFQQAAEARLVEMVELHGVANIPNNTKARTKRAVRDNFVPPISDPFHSVPDYPDYPAALSSLQHMDSNQLMVT